MTLFICVSTIQLLMLEKERPCPRDPTQTLKLPTENELWDDWLKDRPQVRGINCPDKRIIETRSIVDLNAGGKFDAVIIMREATERAFRYIGTISNRKGKSQPQALSSFVRDATVEFGLLLGSSTHMTQEQWRQMVSLIEDPTKLHFMPGVVVDEQATFQEGFKSTTKNLIEDDQERTLFEEILGGPLVYEEIDAVQLGGVVFLDKKKARGKIGVWEELETDGQGKFRFFRKLPNFSEHTPEQSVASQTAEAPMTTKPKVAVKGEGQVGAAREKVVESDTSGKEDNNNKEKRRIEAANKQEKRLKVEPGVYRFLIKDHLWLGDMESNIVKIDEPAISFDEIGGLNKVKADLKGFVAGLRNPELFVKWGIRSPKGILLYGPPGTGKTMVVKALAHEASVPFFSLEFTDMASRWVHQTAEQIKAILTTLDKVEGKKIIFIDEFDSVATSRKEFSSTSGGGSSKRVNEILSPLLEYMDGFRSSYATVFVAATNRKDDVDEAMLRPGRFDRQIEIALPNEEGRQEIFSIHMRMAEVKAARQLFSTIDHEALKRPTRGYSGADIGEIIRRVLENNVQRELSGETVRDLVTTEDLLRELRIYEIKKQEKRLGFRPLSP